MINSIFIFDFLENLVFDSCSEDSKVHKGHMKSAKKECFSHCRSPQSCYNANLPGLSRTLFAKSNRDMVIVGLLAEGQNPEAAWKMLDEVIAKLENISLENPIPSSFRIWVNRLIDEHNRKLEAISPSPADPGRASMRAMLAKSKKDQLRLSDIRLLKETGIKEAVDISVHSNDNKQLNFWEQHKISILIGGATFIVSILALIFTIKLLRN